MVVEDLATILDKAQMEHYYSYTLSKAVDDKEGFMWCLTPGCDYAFAFNLEPEEEGGEAPPTDFECEKCRKVYCVSCKVTWHEGKTCEQNIAENGDNPDEKLFEELAKDNKYKKCPHCDRWVERSEGCIHMSCRCGKDFCYQCGTKWEGKCRWS
jgi:hypothetical protein